MKSSFFDEKHIKFVWKICKIDTISKANIAWKTEKNARIHYEEKKEEDRNRIILNVAKQRNGPVGEVELVWLPQFTKFEDAEQPGDRI